MEHIKQGNAVTVIKKGIVLRHREAGLHLHRREKAAFVLKEIEKFF
jgi:hypothetical protein